MCEKKSITLGLDLYEDMVFRYLCAKDKIMDLELEIFELQEELDRLHEEDGQ